MNRYLLLYNFFSLMQKWTEETRNRQLPSVPSLSHWLSVSLSLSQSVIYPHLVRLSTTIWSLYLIASIYVVAGADDNYPGISVRRSDWDTAMWPPIKVVVMSPWATWCISPVLINPRSIGHLDKWIRDALRFRSVRHHHHPSLSLSLARLLRRHSVCRWRIYVDVFAVLRRCCFMPFVSHAFGILI